MIYPDAVYLGGAADHYQKGRNQMRTCVLHYTVGVDSTGIGQQGYFNFLVRRSGEVVQFAPADSLTWHAGEWNIYGPGIEHEYYAPVDGDQILTDPQRDAAGGLYRWLISLGISSSFYDGARINPPFDGFITHRSLVQSQPHTDFITEDDFQRALNAGDDEVATLYIKKAQPPDEGVWVTDGIVKRWVTPEEWAFATTFGKQKEPLAIGDQWWNSMPVAK